MRWPAFLDRLRRPSAAERLRLLDEQLERSFASRKADRAAMQARARRGARTKARQAIARDPILASKARP